MRGTPIHLGWVLLVCLAALVLSCDEIERRRVLTFFFDGVPPSGGAGFEGEPFDVNSAELEQTGQKPAWYVHEPQKDCTNCHRRQSTGGFSSQTRLIAPVPQLCHKCHDDPAVSASFVHGPVAVGQCLFCHNPHRSKVEHLLREAEPKLCYLCHDTSMIELIPAHLTQQTSACTDCHDPHAGSAKALLKGASSQTEHEPGSGKRAGAAAQEDMSLLKKPQIEELSKPSQTDDKTTQEREKLFEVFWKVSRLIEQGKLQEARGHLEAIKDSKALTEDERAKIENVLRLMDNVSTNGGGKPQEDKQGKPQNEQGATAPGAAEKSDDSAAKRRQEVADLYYRSMAYYRDGQLERARDGFIEVLNSRLIPVEMENTIRSYIADIDRTLARDNQRK